MFISAERLGILAWGYMGIDLEAASSGPFKKLHFLALLLWRDVSDPDIAARLSHVSVDVTY